MPVPSSVPNDQTQPETIDVVVIGGGIAGICTALELSERGLSVAVCEKGIVAGEQSSRNWGWCRQMGRDPRELPLMQHSMLTAPLSCTSNLVPGFIRNIVRHWVLKTGWIPVTHIDGCQTNTTP